MDGAKIGVIGYGTSHWAIIESRDQLLEETDVKTSYLRLRAAKAEQMARAEASMLVVDAKARIQDAEAELDTAPKGKGAPADLDVLKSDLAAAKSTIGEAETALASKRRRYACRSSQILRRPPRRGRR